MDTASWDEHDWARLESSCQPTPMCTRLGGLVVPAHKGDGILWYNLKPKMFPKLSKKKRRWRGAEMLAYSSVHCGAEVLEGEKWFANLWMHPPQDRRDEL